MTGEEVLHRIAKGELKLAGDGDYKLNERRDLASADSFGSFGGFLSCQGHLICLSNTRLERTMKRAAAQPKR